MSEDYRSKAVALQYLRGMEAPIILAKGEGQLAERIIELARKNGIPLTESEELAESLYIWERGLPIPEDLYEAVAEILAFIYTMEAGEKEFES